MSRRTQTKLHSLNIFTPTSIRELKNKEIINKQLEEEEVGSSSNSEKITVKSTIYFVIYLVSLIRTLQIIADIIPSYSFFTAVTQSLQNLYEQPDEFLKINPDKIDFNSIITKDDIFIWTVQTLIPGIYNANRGFQSFDNPSSDTQVLGMQSLTNIRFVQRRAAAEEFTSPDSIYKLKWDKYGGLDYSTYGKGMFNYSSADGGFVYDIPVLFQTQVRTTADFREFWLKEGYIDAKTKGLDIVFAVYNKINRFMVFINVTFEFSAAGVVKNKFFNGFSYPVEPFNDPSLYFWNIAYVIFATYFAIQEFLKVSVHIKNALLKGSIVPTKVGIDAGLKAVGAIREKIKNVLVGLLNHIKDPWTFLNLLSIILSLYTVITWIQIITNNKLENRLISLGMKDGIITNITPEKIETVKSFTLVIAEKVKKFVIVMQILGINVILLMIRSAKFLNAFIKPSSYVSTIIAQTLNKIIPFLILLICLLFSFSIMVSFYYGDLFEDFNGYLKTIFYFFTSINGNFDMAESMYVEDATYSFFFHIIFIIFINFIFAVMFLIYASHVYEDYYKHQVHAHVDLEGLGKFEFTPHPFWIFRNQLKSELKLIFFKNCNKKKYAILSHDLMVREKNERREIAAFSRFNFDMNIVENQKEKSQKNITFMNEIARFKMAQLKKRDTFKILWSIIFSVILAIFFLVVSLQHQKTTEGRSMIKSVESFFSTKNIQVIDPETRRKQTTFFNIPLKALQSNEDFLGWMKLFTSFGTYGSYKLTDGRRYSGYFFGGVNFILTNQYRITIRRSKIVSKDTGAYNSLGRLSISSAFPIDSQGPLDSENTTSIYGNASQKWFNYSLENTYLSAGGYHIYSNISEISTAMNVSMADRVFDQSVAAIVIDFPIYQLTSLNCLYVVQSFVFDDSYNVFPQTQVKLIGLNYYNDSSQRFIGFLEICILISFVVMSYRLGKSLRKKISYYNYWYSTHIAYFPSVMIRTREKKEPEFIRKARFTVEFQEVMDLVFLVFLGISIIVWVVYLTQRSIIEDEIDAFLNDTPDKNQAKLSDALATAVSIMDVSKVFESLLIMAILVKIMYSFGYFKSFKFLSYSLIDKERLGF